MANVVQDVRDQIVSEMNLAEKVKRLATLTRQLAGVSELVKEKDSLLAELSRTPIEVLLAAATPVYVTNGSPKGERKKRETPMGVPDEKLWAKIKKDYFKTGNSAKIDAATRKSIAEGAGVEVGVVNATILKHCEGQLAGPYSGGFTIKAEK
jgi:hypothetical protein